MFIADSTTRVPHTGTRVRILAWRMQVAKEKMCEGRVVVTLSRIFPSP
jgi:hypothetical protein